MLQNTALVAKIGFDTAENGTSKVWAISNQAPTPPWGQINIYVDHDRTLAHPWVCFSKCTFGERSHRRIGGVQ